MEHSLVMSISYPGECAQGANDEGDVSERSNDEDRIRVHRMVSEIVHDLEEEPGSTGKRTTAMNTS